MTTRCKWLTFREMQKQHTSIFSFCHDCAVVLPLVVDGVGPLWSVVRVMLVRNPQPLLSASGYSATHASASVCCVVVVVEWSCRIKFVCIIPHTPLAALHGRESRSEDAV